MPPNAFLTSRKSSSSSRRKKTRRCGPISTLSGVAGAGLSVAHAISPTPFERLAGRLERVRRARRRRRGATGELERRAHEPADAARGEVERGRLRLRAPRLALVRQLRRVRLGVEQHRGEVDAGDAVDERVVGLGDQREAVALEALDEPRLPQRLGAVELLGVDARGERAQLLLRAGRGQRGVADVVLEVEARVVDPHRPARLDRRERELLAVARDEVQPPADLVDEVDVAGRRTLEDHHRADVHVRRRPLLRQEGRVHRGQPITVSLCHEADPIVRWMTQNDKRSIGSHGLEAAPLGLGCMGMSEFYGTADEGEAVRTIHRALELGVTLLDTADMYGPFTNEKLVGPRRPRVERRAAADRDEVRQRPRRERRVPRHPRRRGVRPQRVRGLAPAPRRRHDRPLLPAPRRPGGPDRGDRRRDGRAGAGGQGPPPRALRGGRGDDPQGRRGAPDLGAADASTRCGSARSRRRSSRPSASSASASSPTRRSAAAS